jgi:tetratricopeptide (TPR) repeat protein
MEDALDAFTKAVVLCSKNSLKKVYYNYIGNCLWGLKRYREAMNSYRLALKIDPDYQDAKENLRTLGAMVAGKKAIRWTPRRSNSLELEKEISSSQTKEGTKPPFSKEKNKKGNILRGD